MVAIEDLKHAVSYYPNVLNIWIEVANWMKVSIDRLIKLTPIDMILGNSNFGKKLNVVIFYTKKVIYKNESRV